MVDPSQKYISAVVLSTSPGTPIILSNVTDQLSHHAGAPATPVQAGHGQVSIKIRCGYD
jgi:hypothetical protein